MHISIYNVYRLNKVQGFGKSAKLHSRNSLKMYSSQSENAILRIISVTAGQIEPLKLLRLDKQIRRPTHRT